MTRQVERLLGVRGLDDISVRQSGGRLRASGSLASREDYTVLKDILSAVGLSGSACERVRRSGRIQVRCDMGPVDG